MSETTTAVLAELERLGQLCAEASPGPWVVESGLDIDNIPFRHIEGWTNHGVDWMCLDESDAILIAESRDALPRLIIALRASIEALEWYGTAEPDITARDFITPIPATRALAAIAQALGTEGE